VAEGKQFGHFPLFVACRGRVFLVIGGGRVALRRIRTLLNFDFSVRVVSPKADAEILRLAEAGRLEFKNRPFSEADLEGVSFAAACTDDREVNRLAGQLCRARGIPVSVADAPGECDYFFPAVGFGEGVVAGVTGTGRDHAKVAQAAERVRRALNQQDGEDSDER